MHAARTTAAVAQCLATAAQRASPVSTTPAKKGMTSNSHLLGSRPRAACAMLVNFLPACMCACWCGAAVIVASHTALLRGRREWLFTWPARPLQPAARVNRDAVVARQHLKQPSRLMITPCPLGQTATESHLVMLFVWGELPCAWHVDSTYTTHKQQLPPPTTRQPQRTATMNTGSGGAVEAVDALAKRMGHLTEGQKRTGEPL